MNFFPIKSIDKLW